MSQLYRIEEYFTNGWDLIDETAKDLTKEECDRKLQHYLSVGHNPSYLRAVVDVHTTGQ